MRLFLLLTGLYCLPGFLKAQLPSEIIGEIKTINNALVTTSCTQGKGQLISNRAMNLFFADKAGSYVADGGGITFYKNYITLTTNDLRLSIDHILFEPKSNDEPIGSFMTVGIKAKVADGIGNLLPAKNYNNEFGVTIKKVWLSKVKTYFIPCTEGTDSQKNAMDRHRSSIIHTLGSGIDKKVEAFENTLQNVSAGELPGQDLAGAKTKMRNRFYKDLQTLSARQFASDQADILSETKNYTLISRHWTSISAYIPFIQQRFYAAPSLTSSFEQKRAYPLALTISHSYLWESAKWGRFFIMATGEIFCNNSQKSYSLKKINATDYSNLGGTDTTHVKTLQVRDLYIGQNKNFITPVLRAQFVYIPPDWHFGISCMMEKNFGNYKALNGKLGIPIVLMNQQRKSFIDFEFQVWYFDMANTIVPGRLTDKTTIGLSLGIPVGDLIY
ncbi:MAG: hypothetical protein V4557_09385 [Bacteroidota bacterium]